ncbi:sigma-54 dependent transcriptional regulator [Halomonas sp. M5N1S17]|uniref:sigma-54 interaction domain-containing protein n=1 Tax=Halomonas alkalisoli TaxID=2907158 RepID=UPI001F20E90D|nr:sigma-54 dependent transcriptional regulator [Halomonas alkalisoli]MCE9662137.1 sigma-54 dependent transcriptional regulator [Halomonas alkalisoli]
MAKTYSVIMVDRVPGRSDSLSEFLSNLGWNISLFSDYDEARRGLARCAFSAGLIRVQAETATSLLEVENLILDCEIEWIALTDKIGTFDPDYRQAISQLFYCTYTLDSEMKLLDCLLTHLVQMHAISLKVKHATYLPIGDRRMVSNNPGMQKKMQQIRTLAAVNAPVFITGESGTGKELAARAIHAFSSRAHFPFITVNCGAIPDSLIQSELFGHEKGAFTDANQRRTGKIEAASGGTLFLDEISDLPYSLQANFLRFIESHKIFRLGSHTETTADVRIISASNACMEDRLSSGEFRQDLYFRLNVLALHLPPLRERKEDIELLTQLFFEKFLHYKHENLVGFSQDALSSMLEYDWPGNIRELMNTVCRSMLMSSKNYIDRSDLRLASRKRIEEPLTLEEIRDAAERSTIISALKRNHQNISRAARETGVSRVTFYRLMDKYQIVRMSEPSPDDT